MIKNKKIDEILLRAQKQGEESLDEILLRAEKLQGLDLEDVAVLLELEDEKSLERLYELAGRIKEKIYGKRVVMFAPLYISNYCINSCSYCGYRCQNNLDRKKLSGLEIQEEVRELLKMGHKRLALEAGEDDINCSIDYIVDSINTIYGTEYRGEKIRRINVNIASTSVENYKKLKSADIGTYILFQETYHRETYEKMHPAGPKSSYDYHLTAFNRAMEAGIDDVGAGVLFGLYDYKYEVLGLLSHNNYLEENYGVGFHTVSVPRIKRAKGIDLTSFKHILSDEEFKKIVAILRIALPFVGIIISTREDMEMRGEIIDYGVSQVSAASSTEVGGYKTHKTEAQFERADSRTMDEMVQGLIEDGYIPSFCTACYRMGRTGEEFMDLVNHEKIKDICTPNGLLTLYEYSLDHMDEAMQDRVLEIVEIEGEKLAPSIRPEFKEKIGKLRSGERDLYF